MQASEIYELGCRAYNGERDARREWFAIITRLAMPIAVKYGVLPGLFAAKAALESGYGSDKYEVDFYEPQFGVKMGRKAQKHNNVIGMNAFRDNITFLYGFPTPKWDDYQETFRDYGPHYHGSHIELTANEPWMHFRSVEDCCEAWCANMRWQAEKNHKAWGTTIEQQLLAIESYTPEGSQAETPGMHYEWQDYVLYIYKDYDLYAYDREAYKMSVKMTTENLDEHIKQAYAYAHTHCKYGPTDTHFPPGEPVNPGEKGVIDCCGLVFRAFYTMGRLASALNINQIPLLCESAGMKRSTDPNDVWKHHCVVCMQDKHLKNTEHVSHVYYSLGGSGLQKISKYDLGSNDRIKAPQPYSNVPVNEWTDKRNFYCCFYIDESSAHEDVPEYRISAPAYAEVVTACGIYAGPGTAYRKLGALKPGEEVLVHGIVTNSAGNNWKAVKVISRGLFGYVGSGGVKKRQFAAYDGRVSGTDGNLALRVGAGTGSSKTADIPEGALIYVDGMATAPDGSSWLHVVYKKKSKKLRGFASAKFIEKRG